MAKSKTLDKNTKAALAEHLSHLLADTFILYVKTLSAHWNMVGPHFYMYHKLLQEQYEEMAEGADELAERIRMLGHKAPGTMAHFLKLGCLKESTTNKGWLAMIKDLIHAHETMVEHLHPVIAFCDEVLDQGSSDLLVERIRFHDKAVYLLQSHINK